MEVVLWGGVCFTELALGNIPPQVLSQTFIFLTANVLGLSGGWKGLSFVVYF